MHASLGGSARAVSVPSLLLLCCPPLCFCGMASRDLHRCRCGQYQPHIPGHVPPGCHAISLINHSAQSPAITQVMFDQFISAGESKWLRQTGLTLLLPHGYDGQGPEHSSARLERFLQMSDEDPFHIPTMDEDKRTQIQQTNWVVCNVTTPANYFHVLRRQARNHRRVALELLRQQCAVPLCCDLRRRHDHERGLDAPAWMQTLCRTKLTKRRRDLLLRAHAALRARHWLFRLAT